MRQTTQAHPFPSRSADRFSPATSKGGSYEVAQPAPFDDAGPSEVAAPAIDPSLEDRLAHAERELVCAEMIDGYRRMQEETSYWRRQVSALKAKIAERDGGAV